MVAVLQASSVKFMSVNNVPLQRQWCPLAVEATPTRARDERSSYMDKGAGSSRRLEEHLVGLSNNNQEQWSRLDFTSGTTAHP